MSWLDFFSRTVTALVTSGVSAVVVIFLIQRFAGRYFDEKLERYKSDLAKNFVEHEVSYRRYDQRQEDAIVNATGALYDLLDHVTRLVNQTCSVAIEHHDLDELREKIIKANDECRGCLFKQRLYLPDDVWKEMKALHDSIQSAYSNTIKSTSKRPPGSQSKASQTAEAERDKANNMWPELLRLCQLKLAPRGTQIKP